jgi:putative phosphoesterase
MSAHRIALISDIHGNELALRQVLTDVRRVGVDQIACLGDVATLGPRPQAVLELVRRECDIFILGNHDEYLFDPVAMRSHVRSPLVQGAIEQCRDELGVAELEFVESFERKVLVSLGRQSTLLLFHGSPDANDRDLLSETPEPELACQLGDHAATVLAGGHTHIQMLRQHRGQLLINPGSVGMPFERFVGGGAPKLMAHAEYAVVESRHGNVAVTLHRVALSRTALARAASRWQSPLAPYLTQQYNSDA